jgi:hypothetical protein
MSVLWGGLVFFMIVLAVIMTAYSVAIWIFLVSQIEYFHRVNAETKPITDLPKDHWDIDDRDELVVPKYAKPIKPLIIYPGAGLLFTILQLRKKD